MPITPTYPGVYIEEIPSGVRTIVGVATSITAFVGRARRGPDNKATVINSYGDFERIFGGLWIESRLGYAVRDFYLNGGNQAVIVRLYHDEAGKEPKAKFTVGGLALEAAEKGAWGTDLRITIDRENITDALAKQLGLPTKDDLFNLDVRDTGTGLVEHHHNLTIKPSPRRIDRVLEAESKLLRYTGQPTGNEQIQLNLEVNTVKFAADPVGAKEEALKQARQELQDAYRDNPEAPDPAKIQAEKNARAAVEQARQDAADDASDGGELVYKDFIPPNGEANKQGLYALDQADLFNLLCIPPYQLNEHGGDVDKQLLADAAAYCEKRRALLLIDAHSSWSNKAKARDDFSRDGNDYPGVRSRNAAIFFPRLKQPNPLRDQQIEEFAPSGALAGVFARTDAQRGVWKAPAGLDATLVGVPELSVHLTDAENGELNPLGLNCLRAFPNAGRVVWGARTLRGADQLADEYKYIPIRRLALYIEESLYRGSKWAVFEPNDEPLWAQLRLNIGAFMHNLFRQGAFQGSTPREAYLVKCDKETTTQNDINLGIVNIVVGFAPLKPAEFVILKIQQLAGKIEV